MGDKARYAEFLEFSKSVGDFLIQGRASPELLGRIRSLTGGGNPCGLILFEIEKYDEWINDMPSEEAENLLAVFPRELDKPIKDVCFFSVQMKPSRYALLYGSRDNRLFPIEALRAFGEAVKTSCGLMVTMAVSDRMPEVERLPEAYREGRSLLLQRVFVGPGSIIEQSAGALREGLPIDYILSQMNVEIPFRACGIWRRIICRPLSRRCLMI